MKLKELKRTVNVSWSPADHHPVTLVAGSAAQQVDASFSSSSYLELYSLNLEDPSYDLKQISSLQTQHKFHKIEWSGAGIIIGGCDGGLLEFYSAEKLLNNASDALLGSSTKHSGHVSALDVNPYQKNLLASGASESEIFIWDLNNTSQPMAPGTRSQPYDHVQGLAWNQQVQHILGSTFATRCVVWDLRKNEPIMKLSDSQSRSRWRAVSWHPGVATQLCLASEDDQAPVIQLWDLRLAASPVVTLEGHGKGALSMSWCAQDADLLLSAGKDGRVLCWNPNTTKPGGEVVAECAGSAQWVFEVRWCPRVPALFAAAAFDQRLAVHSVLGGAAADTSSQSQSNIMDSFGAESFSQLPAVRGAQGAGGGAGAGAGAGRGALAAPPRWMKRPVRANFGFGGKLVTFEKCPQQEGGAQRLVHISQVVSDPEIVELAAELDAVLGSSPSQDPEANQRLAEYCRQRGDAATDQSERYTWFFLRANFLPSFRSEVLNLLGFRQDEIPSKFKTLDMSGDEAPPDPALPHVEGLSLLDRKLADVESEPAVSDVHIPNGDDETSMICRALVCGNLEEAVELCLAAERVADALVIASLGSQELVYKVQKYHLNRTCAEPVSALADALLAARWGALLARTGARAWRSVLAALVTHCDTDALPHYCETLGDKLSKESDPALVQAATICYLCAMSPERLARVWGALPPRHAAPPALLAHRAAALRHAQLQSGGKLETILNEYALNLASQGCLQSALLAAQDSGSDDLKQRLQRALGITQDPAHKARAPAHGGARGYGRRDDVTAHYNSAVPPQYDPSPWQQSTVSAHQYSQPPLAPLAPQPLAPQTFAPQPLAPQPLVPQPPAPQPPPPAAPPRPGSVGPTAGGLASRSKYRVDPSVQPAPPCAPYPARPYTPTHPAVNGTYYNPPGVETGVPVVPTQNKPAAPGWNDPPMLSSKPKAKSETPVPAQAPITHPLFGVEPPQHIPLAPAPGQYPGMQPGQYQGSQFPAPQPSVGQYSIVQQPIGQYPGGQQHIGQYPGAQQPDGQYPGAQQLGGQYPGAQYPGGQYQDQQYQAQYPPQPPPQQYTPQVEPQPAPKPPLPPPLAALQDTFDGLREQLARASTSSLVKRKLEDVQRRLETMYDLLREDRLSESCVCALTEMSACVRAGDAGGALRGAGALAAGGDFAAVASFLPGLKTLFQLAAAEHAPR